MALSRQETVGRTGRGTAGRALVLRALGLGDVLTAVPALRAIRRGLPDHEIVLAGPAALADLVVAPDLVDRVLPAQGLAPIEWDGPGPDTAVDLHGCGPESHRLLQSLHPTRLVGFACAAAGIAGPPWRAGEHEVRRWCRLVTEAGWPADPSQLRLSPPSVSSPAPGAVVVHPGAAYPSRRWPAERFAAVARWATDQGLHVVVTGSAAEVPLARTVADAAGLGSGAVLAGRTELTALAALVHGARLVVCGDTGTAHLATAFGTPSVVLFGPVPPSEWGPPADGPHTVVWHGAGRAAAGGRGDPHGDAVDPALLATTVDEVVAAMRERLRFSRSRDSDSRSGADREALQPAMNQTTGGASGR
ncbi:glycosyltransferase family 9 protein [Terrabacter sp. NPDC080008]|uniref:glycosyltransferase family 9 protein n=1 Tax=Terrabacter sp. NPDC080008 TaxID=3155176 RepID=UPI00345094FE